MDKTKPITFYELANSERQLVLNQIQTPDGTILISWYSHDFQYYFDSKSKECYINDGGNNYARRSVNKVPAKDISIYADDDFVVVRKIFRWGTYGKVARLENFKWIFLCDMSDEHIRNIIVTQKQINEITKGLFVKELKYRKAKFITVVDLTPMSKCSYRIWKIKQWIKKKYAEYQFAHFLFWMETIEKWKK